MSQARLNDLRKQSVPVLEHEQEDSESEYTDETVTDSEDEEEEDLSNDPEAQEKRTQRELKLFATKLKAFKDKEASARRERVALREQLKIQQKALKEERTKYKVGREYPVAAACGDGSQARSIDGLSVACRVLQACCCEMAGSK